MIGRLTLKLLKWVISNYNICILSIGVFQQDFHIEAINLYPVDKTIGNHLIVNKLKGEQLTGAKVQLGNVGKEEQAHLCHVP